MNIIVENLFFPQGFLGLLIVGVLCQLITWNSYRRMVVDSVEMEGRKKRWIGILRKRFESYYQLEANLRNISSVVDKEFGKNRICGVPEKWMKQGSIACAITCFFLALLGTLRNCIRGALLDFSVPGFLMFSLAGVLLIGVHEIFDVKNQKELIRANMIYFLENILPNRCEKKERKTQQVKVENQKKQETVKKENKKEEKEVKEIEEHWKEIAAAKEFALTKEEMQMMKEILHEI